MDRGYWERVGADYERAIFDSSSQDTHGVVRERLDEYADPSAVACDFGCGVGHYLPHLARRFGVVYGVDFAESLLVQARARSEALDNVTVLQANLASARAKLSMRKARVAVCANVLISADAAKRRGILRTVARHVSRGGHALFVVPSLESALYSNQQLVEWNRRSGFDAEEALASGIPPTGRGARELLRGLVRIENVPTKHYLREEACAWLEAEGFRVASVDKVEYAWATEFESPPRWMRAPGPWDWLLVGRRRST
jgi:SAM-dependent methyltransferase